MTPSQRIETRITAVLVVLVLLCCENASTVHAASTTGDFETTGAAGKYNADHAPGISRQDPRAGHHDVVRALQAEANYTTFAALLDNMTESVIRSGITVFAPSNQALSDFQIKNPAEERLQDVIRFHIVPVSLPFSNLLRLDVGSTLPTEMANLTIQVTNATASAYQVDDAVIVRPDLYSDASVAVHGINAVFNTSKFTGGEEDTEPTAGGGSRNPPGSSFPPTPRSVPSPPRPAAPPAASPPRPAASPPGSSGTPLPPGECEEFPLPPGPSEIDLLPPIAPPPTTNHAPIRQTFKIPILLKDVTAYEILMSVIVVCFLKLTVSVV